MNHYPNALTSFTLGDSIHLIYGEYSDDCHIVRLAEVNENSNQGRTLKLKNKKNLSRYEIFYRADSSVINNTPFALLQLDDGISFLRIDSNSFTAHSLSETNKTVDCCLNRYVSGNFAFTNKDGFVSIYDSVNNQYNWRGQFFDSLDKAIFTCEFGCHPLHLNVCCASGLWLIDARNGLLPSQSRQLFNINKMSKYLDVNDEICNLKSVPSCPFVYLICSETVFLMDIRHYNHPVLSWYHMMKDRPSYPQFLNGVGTDALLMADPQLFQMCMIASQSSEKDYSDVKSISTPRHFNVKDDCLRLARLNNVLLTYDLEFNLRAPLVGLTVCSMENKKESLVLFQNAFGNIFYSLILEENKNFKEAGTFELWEKFEKELCKQSKPNFQFKLKNAPPVENLYLNKLKAFGNTISCSLFKTPAYEGYVWNLGSIYKERGKSKSMFNSEADEDIIDRIRENNSTINFFSQKDQNNLNYSHLKECSDPLSKLMLSVWETNDEADSQNQNSQNEHKNPFVYRRIPFCLIQNADIEMPTYNPAPSLHKKAKSDLINAPRETSPENEDDKNCPSQEETLSHNNCLENERKETTPLTKLKKNKKHKRHVSGF